MAVTAVVLFALLLVAGGLLAYGVSIYNGLVAVKHQVDQAWANIDVLLKQRHDELPKLIDSVKSYMTHERELLETLTSLRARTETASASERMAAENELGRGVARLLAVAESYPQLRASEVFMDMQQRISALEEQIAHRREFYNAAVNINNVRMEQFPDVLLVSIAAMQRRTLFEVQAQDLEDVDVGARLRS
jgi:LemA protein